LGVKKLLGAVSLVVVLVLVFLTIMFIRDEIASPIPAQQLSNGPNDIQRARLAEYYGLDQPPTFFERVSEFFRSVLP
jgi:ABC-type dipeptide/oligopeptide/nickel transport system permease component